MSYVSVLKNIPEFLSQPAGIAAIASVGIHGAIAFILPLMPVDSKVNQNASPKSVGVMELSEAEQSRLPQNNSPQVSALPQVPLQSAIPLPNFAVQPTPLDTIPPSPDSTKVIIPSLPESSVNPNISSLPKSQPLPILPQPNFDSSFNVKAKSDGSYRRFNQNINLGQSAPLASRKRNAAPITSSPYNLPDIPPIQSAPLPPELAGIPAPPPLPPTSGNDIVAINPQINPDMNINGAVTQPRAVNPEDFIAPVNRSIPQPGDNLTLAGQSLQQWGQQSGPRRIELPNQPSTAAENTNQNTNQNTNISPQDARTLTLAKQFEEVRERYPNSEIKQPISEVVKTKPGKEGKIEGTLVIDSEGKADYLKFVDRSVSSELQKETRNYFRNYFKENPIRRNGKAKVYAFTLDFKSDVTDTARTVEFSKPQDKLADRLRSSKQGEVQVNQNPSKPENISRSSVPVKVDAQPNRSAVVVPSVTPAPVTSKPQAEIRTNKPASASENNDQTAVEVRLRNNQQVPSVPAKPTPQARVNIKEPAPQVTSKPSLANRLVNRKEDSVSEENSSKASNSAKKLIQRLREVKEQRSGSK
ncbi:hypothetical protein IQ247_24600 [Plectonema cf. radiosum LEGE 06105]|uniref:TonB family protein n=1 Tax=Plectonema cf. radiosum LEGE 06105 TaxID=945769 RepID=A0A8J7F5Q6_9CYAN|nr:hypothetical protein [Plectonema radiosum]MBE9215805.1 hypothetical protein [Plectonema cf. radiosum LEGE 06105]